MRVSVVMPAYNEEQRIGKAVSRVLSTATKAGFDFEVVIVNDGSTDGTKDEVKSIAETDRRVRLVSYNQNRGKGYAIRRGIEVASGQNIVLLDSDGEIHPDELKNYIKGLSSNDICIGCKWHPQSIVETSILRRILSHIFHFLVRLLTNLECGDTQTGLKAFRKEALEKIVRLQLVKRYSFDVELLAVAHLLELRIGELPVEMKIRGRFKIHNIIIMFLELIGIAYRLRVRRWYQNNLNNQEPKYKPFLRI